MTQNEEYKPFQYQREGVDTLKPMVMKNPSRAALLADEPGVGKTCQAVILAKELSCANVLIVCPASLRLNWEREVRMWWPEISDRISIIRSGKDHLPTSGVVIISYKLASSGPMHERLSSCLWDILIMDEAHAVKSPTSQTARALLITLWSKAKYRLAITGTPVPNGRASEAWSLFSRMAPELFGTWTAFCSRYCVLEMTPWGPSYPRSRNLTELGNIARSKFMVRRRLEDVQSQLPEIVRCKVPLDIPRIRVAEAQEGLSSEMVERIKVSMDSIPLRSDPLSTARRKLGILKVSGALDYLLGVTLEEVDKCVVFCHHREVFYGLLDGFEAAGVSVVSVSGQTPLNERQEAVDAFQDEGSGARIFLGSLTAANTGITLTAASTVVFVEFGWVPSDNEQAEARISRVGQKHDVLRSIYLIVPDSLDEAMAWSVTRKQWDIKRIMAA